MPSKAISVVLKSQSRRVVHPDEAGLLPLGSSNQVGKQTRKEGRSTSVICAFSCLVSDRGTHHLNNRIISKNGSGFIVIGDAGPTWKGIGISGDQFSKIHRPVSPPFNDLAVEVPAVALYVEGRT